MNITLSLLKISAKKYNKSHHYINYSIHQSFSRKVNFASKNIIKMNRIKKINKKKTIKMKI